MVNAITKLNGANVPSPAALPQAATLLPCTAGLPEPLVFLPYRLVPPPRWSLRPPTLCSRTSPSYTSFSILYSTQCHLSRKLSLSALPSLLGLLSPSDSQDHKTLVALAASASGRPMNSSRANPSLGLLCVSRPVPELNSSGYLEGEGKGKKSPRASMKQLPVWRGHLRPTWLQMSRGGAGAATGRSMLSIHLSMPPPLWVV